MFEMFIVFSLKNIRNFLDLYNNVKGLKGPSSLAKRPIIFLDFPLTL